MTSTLSNLLYHVVFSTKYRSPTIGDEILHRLHAYMGGIVTLCGGISVEIGGIGDHVHLLIAARPSVSLADIVRRLKISSSKWMTEQTGSRFAWQVGYGAFTVSESASNKVRLYIRNQKSHHEKQNFDDEFRLLLDKHGIKYDSKNIFE